MMSGVGSTERKEKKRARQKTKDKGQRKTRDCSPGRARVENERAPCTRAGSGNPCVMNKEKILLEEIAVRRSRWLSPRHSDKNLAKLSQGCFSERT
jgi:hypothetical protein